MDLVAKAAGGGGHGRPQWAFVSADFCSVGSSFARLGYRRGEENGTKEKKETTSTERRKGEKRTKSHRPLQGMIKLLCICTR
jgi:hypothetical protein